MRLDIHALLFVMLEDSTNTKLHMQVHAAGPCVT